jgi:hypothetical protein
MQDRVFERERLEEEVLVSNLDPITKVQRLIDMGYDEENAHELVERYQIGALQPVYYERLELDDFDFEDR